MRTRHQLKIEAVAPSCPPKVWHLDLKLSKENMADDLKSLSFIPTIDRLSSASTQSKTVDANKNGSTPKQAPTAEARQERNKESAEEKKLPKDKFKAPCKRRLTSKAENDAVGNLYKFCQDMWKERKAEAKDAAVDDNKMEGVEDIRRGASENKQEDSQRDHGAIAEASAYNPPQDSYQIAGEVDRALGAPSGFFGSPTEQMATQYNEFHQKYLAERAKNSQLHVVAAYRVFQEQLRAYRRAMEYAEEREKMMLGRYISGENFAMQPNYYS
eukprot:TRINITY_DN14312_c0_g1_i1.p1 TRINITY_DN14312_c0_g1~~TRINITY_DN14312_c0_g1_i1.p1  ORF type:complete len:271 (+),score=52.32 TRINITY_DN14312_c0_g1_i1:71-883(+)